MKGQAQPYQPLTSENAALVLVDTTTARDSMWRPTFPELVEALPGIQIIDRSTVNAWAR